MEIHSSHHHFHDFLVKPADFRQIAHHPHCISFRLPASLHQPRLTACSYSPNTYQIVRTSEPKRIPRLSKMLRSSKLLHGLKTEQTILTSFLADTCLTSNKGDSTTSPSCLFLSLIIFIVKINNLILPYNLKTITSCTASHKHGNRFLLSFRAVLSIRYSVTRSLCFLFSGQITSDFSGYPFRSCFLDLNTSLLSSRCSLVTIFLQVSYLQPGTLFQLQLFC